MFRINSNQEIRISKGDTVYFPLFLNKGKKLNPIRYEFKKTEIKYYSSSKDMSVSLNETTWKSKVTTEGVYIFKYLVDKWYYNNTVVNLSDYGLSVTGTVRNEDGITVDYKIADNNEYVDFYVIHRNSKSKPILQKRFYSNNIIKTYHNGTAQGDKQADNVNDNHDMIIRLDAEDTSFINEGSYIYQIIANLKDDTSTSGYSINTVTNRTSFNVIDDDYDANFIFR